MPIKKIILYILALLFITAVLGIGAYFYIQKQILNFNVPNGTEKIIVIENGENIGSIAAKLESEKLVKSAFYFKFYLWQNKSGNKLQAGKYLLSAKMTIPEIVRELVNGNVVPEGAWIIIPEGFTNKDIDERLAEAGLIKSGEIINFKISDLNKPEEPENDILSVLLKTAAEKPTSRDFLKSIPAGANLEGFLFPDTYRFKKDATAEYIIKKMLDNFDKKIDGSIIVSIDGQKHSFKGDKPMTMFEIITMASIVQKEVRSPKDMKIAAGIFYNRLNAGMKLEADSTLNFITDSHRDRATYDDLKIDSPYNTYKYAGLPPGPISNPGLDAINAAINPEKTDYYYFLTASDGHVVYGKTYDEHLKNIAKWLD